MKRQLNFRFLGLLIAVVGAFALGGHVLHGHQLKRNAGYLLKHSKDAASQKDYSTALRYLSHYLTLRPDDAVVRARFGVILAKLAKTKKPKVQAFLTLERALRDEPDLERLIREDPELQQDQKSEDKENAAIAADLINVRRRTAVLAMDDDLQQYPDAKVHIELLLKAQPRDAELLVLLGQCEEESGQHVQAVKAYTMAIEADPSRVEAYTHKASLLRSVPKAGGAEGPEQETPDKVIGQMIDANRNSVRARLAAVKHYRSSGNLKEARDNLKAAQSNETVGDKKEVLLVAADLALADLAMTDGQMSEAREELVSAVREKLERGLKEYPEEPKFYFLLASLEIRAKKPSRAVAILLDLMKVLPEHSPELWVAADYMIDAREPTQARKLLEQLQKEQAGAAEIDFLQARLLLDEGQSIQAEKLLIRCRPHFVRQAYLAIRTELLLTLCYERLGKTDLQLKAAQAAVNLDRGSIPARKVYASALVSAGKVDEALVIYRSLIAQDEIVRLVIARLNMSQNRTRPVKERNLALANEMLSGASEDLKQRLDYHLVRAEVLATEGSKEKLTEARRIVSEGRNRFPKDPQFWILFAQIVATTSASDGFAQLALAQAELGDHVSLRLAKASMVLGAARAAGKQADSATLRNLEEQSTKFTEAEQAQFYRGLAEIHLQAGSVADAERLLRVLVERRPNDLLLLARLFDVVASKSNPSDIAELKDKLRLAEGEDGSIWRFAEALESWLRYLTDQNPETLKHASNRLAQAGKRRPDWFRVSLLEAEIEDRLGHTDAAIEKYLTAIRLGVRQPAVIQRTTLLLTARGRDEEVRHLIDEALRGSSEAPPELIRLDALNLLKLGEDPEQVRKRLEEGAPESSEDFQIQLFRGTLLSGLRRTKEAESAYRRAVALNPKSGEVWIQLVNFLVRNDRLPDAKSEIEKAVLALPNEKKSAALGACYEAVGNRAEAEKYYLLAVSESGDDELALRNLASFYYYGGDSAKAEPIFRQLIALSTTVRFWARRNLAVVLASSGDYARGTEALGELDRNLRDNPGDPEDLRVRSLILRNRPGERGLSIKELEAMLTRVTSPPEELLLAQLYELDGNWPKALERYLGLLSGRGGDNPTYIAHFVLAQLRHDDIAGAARWLARLEAREKSDPKRKEGPSPVVVELKARLLVKQGNPSMAANLLKEFAQRTFKEEANPKILESVGLLMSELKLDRDAEALLRQYVLEAEMKTPAAVLVLAEFLARQKRVGEALTICSNAVAKVNPELVARMAVGVVRLGEASGSQFAEAESIIQNAAQKKPGSSDIPISLADLRDAQGRYDDAKAMYREMIKSPRNVLAMNNLAWLLALQEGNHEEALRIITDAIKIRGPHGNLLDTRAVIYILAGRPAEAISDLTAAISQEPLPERYFHLAQAHLKAGNKIEAARAMRKVRDLNRPKESYLHRLEWKSYEELMALIGGK